ncbi:MAG: transcription-repair coupling factor [Lachnospiraceae bacterium]|nr:transcription-repair coupling factor [Lachnospiraceae bacterium]
MSYTTLTAPLAEMPAYRKLIETLAPAGACALAEGCVDSQKQHLIHALSREEALASHARFRLILTYSDRRAREIQQEYSFYDRNVTMYPAKDLIFYQADLRSREIDRERIRCLKRVMEGRPATVVTTFAALMAPQVPLDTLRQNVLQIDRHGRLEPSEAAEKLVAMGYEKNFQVEKAGQFAVRGDILDIFDLTEENPYRIELWGDEVESIRSFDVLSQRSLEKLESLSVYPAAEMILEDRRLQEGLRRIRKESEELEKRLRKELRTEEAHRLKTSTEAMIEEAREFHDFSGLESYIRYFYPQTENFLDLFPREETMLFFDEPVRIRQQAEAVETEFRESMTSRAEKGYILPGQMDLLYSEESVRAQTLDYRRLGIAQLADGCGSFGASETVSMHARTVAPYNKSFETLEKDLQKYRKDGSRVMLLSPSRTRAKRLAQDLTNDGITAFYSENPRRILKPGEIMTAYGRVQHGFEYPEIGFCVITESDIFGTEKQKKKKRHRYEGESIQHFSELKVGDYIVHEDYGIGIYKGVEKVEVDHIAKDYIRIEYGGGGTLYVLPTDLSSLQKYAASDTEAKPKLNKLGTQEWTNTRARVKKAVDEVAEDLVELYAKRQSRKGHAFEKDTVWQREFEEMFPYQETEDQLTAIADTKRDMESDRIMDRLICGDVGYGKTEIAIRAAFKAVQDGKQVAVLVPTTILAQQHFNTFTERLHNFPVTIGLLSRFRTAAEQKETLAGLRSGKVDIVIGTHRLLSKDVKFRDLGLLVVDEEQRFGVNHKERIKKMREDVDVLTLSATPIPRTLHMSLVGIRDMSVLEEAPEERVPIQTYVMAYDEEMVREAISRELSRGGQVYYVYNYTADIDRIAAKIKDLVPEANVAFAHGKMSESELERIMYDFISGEIDVLVSTTIIETGLDISNVNTIVIHDSDRMGLSQLHQLRGRVGRSGRTAYAFLMYRKDRVLKEVAEKRLAAIREFTDLGSGFRIAMRDLEIRGAGSILGRAQHGHMNAVGYDLYCKMLNVAVKRAKGEDYEEKVPVRVNLDADAFLPENYIVNEEQKLEIYRKIAEIASTEDCDTMREELQDRFGDVPAPAENLLRIALIRTVAGYVGVQEITGRPGELHFKMNPRARGLRADRIPRLLEGYAGSLTFSAGAVPQFEYRYKPSGTPSVMSRFLLEKVEELLVRFNETLRSA